MTQRHWTNEELLNHLYGVDPEDGHTAECPECRGRIAGMERRRAARQEEPWVPEEFLRAQRESIARRVGEANTRQGAWWQAPAWAALMAAIALVLSWPQPPREKLTAGRLTSGSDAGMYLEIYQTISTEEPRALAPMHNLFEE